ncbi:MAG: tetratricopeptide repeat protein [Planctomycetota bacterium]|nr:tetratricopeptide repeat protein [Planctomycetota bacterium]
MPDAPTASPGSSDAAATPPAAAPSSRGWRDAWQIPTAILAIALVASGVALLVSRAPGPDYEAVLHDVETLIERQEPARALDLLNGPITLELGQPGAPEDVRGRFHALRGEALFLTFRTGAPDMKSEAAKRNNENTLKEFEEAEHRDHALLTPRRERFIAETLLDLRRYEEALDKIRHLPEDVATQRRDLLRRLIEETGRGTRTDRDLSNEALAALAEDEGLADADRLWIALRRARAMMGRGEADGVIDLLLPELQRSGDAGGLEAGDVHLMLGRAYLMSGDIPRASRHLSEAETLLPPGNERGGEVEVGLAKVAQAQGDIEEARDRYATVIERYPGSDAHSFALLGLGEAEADTGQTAASIAAFRELAADIRGRGLPPSLSIEEIAASVEQRHRAAIVNVDLPAALAYAQIMIDLYPPESTPAGALIRLAETHRALAEEATGEVAEGESLTRLLSLPPDRLEQARTNLAAAGEAYLKHSAAAMVESAEAASASAWLAADCFDRAGDQERAIRLFSDYVDRRRNDPRYLEGKYRLARCFQARNDYAAAISLFEEIIKANSTSDEAYRSYVPLAQCYLLQSSDADAEKAERLLLQVLDGRMFSPEAPQFRRALIELGQLYLRVGRYPDAMMRLAEAIERYPAAVELPRLKFDLADACRLSAAQLRQQLNAAMPLSARSELEALRVERLRRALGLYEEVRAALDGRDPAKLSPIQTMLLRNAVLYRGDCAFDLGDYDTAIRHYDAAAQRFGNDPGSLVPMVQIVNCYAAQGRWPEARTAHERARSRLKELPPEAWQHATVPMDRERWEKWLDASMRISEERAAADQPPPG